MLSKVQIILFYTFLTILFLSSMWGILYEYNLATYSLWFFPLILISIDTFSKRGTKIPHNLGIVFVSFLILTSISTLFAVNLRQSFEKQLIYISVFLLFIFAYNKKTEIKKYFLPFVFISSLISLIYSALIWMNVPYSRLFIPENNSQLIYKVLDYSHYPQGVFILMLATVLFIRFYYRPSVSRSISLGVALILLLLSYLRSAYVGICAVIFLNYFNSKKVINRKIFLILFFFILFLSVLFYITPTLAFRYQISFFSHLHNTISLGDYSFNSKSLTNGRLLFTSIALQAIKEKPLVGYGPGNYIYAAMQYGLQEEIVVKTSHNILLDMISENGIPAGTLFILLLGFILFRTWKIIKKRNADRSDIGIASLFIALLVLFQFNYYHLRPYLFTLLFLAAALFYEERKNLYTKKLFLILSVVVAGVGVLILTASIFDAVKKPEIAVRIYPLKEYFYHNLIRKYYRENRVQELEKVIITYDLLYGQIPESASFIGAYYELQKDDVRALEYYQRALLHYPRNTGHIVRVYRFISKISSEEQAKHYIEDHLQQYPVLYPGIYFEDQEWFEDWCYNNDINCDYQTN